MATLGDLEHAVMDALWDAGAPISAGEVQTALSGGRGGNSAVTTVLTVLSRLEKKGFVTRDRRTRPHLYSALSTRADYMAELMHAVLGSAPDREAVLARFVGQVDEREAAALRRMLDSL